MKKRKDVQSGSKRKDYSNLEILASAGINVEEINALAEKARGSYLFFVSENLESVERDALQQMAGVLQILKCWCRERKGDWAKTYCRRCRSCV